MTCIIFFYYVQVSFSGQYGIVTNPPPEMPAFHMIASLVLAVPFPIQLSDNGLGKAVKIIQLFGALTLLWETQISSWLQPDSALDTVAIVE